LGSLRFADQLFEDTVMTEPGILGAFAGHEFLKGLSQHHLMFLASGARPFQAKENEVLAREDETAKSFYLIQSGRVAVEIHRPGRGAVRLQTIEPGDVVGWSWIVPPYRWQFDVRALEPVSGLAFDATWLRERCEQDHEMGYHLLKQLIAVIARRLMATRQQLPEKGS
jgi:CRP-like cAMP-binding protein